MLVKIWLINLIILFSMINDDVNFVKIKNLREVFGYCFGWMVFKIVNLMNMLVVYC